MIGVLVVSGAVWAVLHGDNEDEEGEAEGREPPPDLPEATSTDHLFPPEYTGPVWITVDADDATPRDVTIRWGTYERIVVHQSGDPVSYEFAKEREETADTNVPAEVEIDPGAEVEFHHGDPPDDAIDVNEGWLLVEDATTTTSLAPTTTTPA
jgi:hypothetical protein